MSQIITTNPNTLNTQIINFDQNDNGPEYPSKLEATDFWDKKSSNLRESTSYNSTIIHSDANSTNIKPIEQESKPVKEIAGKVRDRVAKAVFYELLSFILWPFSLFQGKPVEVKKASTLPFENVIINDHLYRELLEELQEKHGGNVRQVDPREKKSDLEAAIDPDQMKWIEEMRNACDFRGEPSKGQLAAWGVVYRMANKCTEKNNLKELSQKFKTNKKQRPANPFILKELEETRQKVLEDNKKWLALQICDSMRVKLKENEIPTAAWEIIKFMNNDNEVREVREFVDFINNNGVDLKKINRDNLKKEFINQCHRAVVENFKQDSAESYMVWLYGEKKPPFSLWQPSTWY